MEDINNILDRILENVEILDDAVSDHLVGKIGDPRYIIERDIEKIRGYIAKESGIGVLDLFTICGLIKSNSEAVRLIKQGGLYINNKKVEDMKKIITEEDLASETMLVLRKGKTSYHLVKFEE